MKPYIASDLLDMNRSNIFQLLSENGEISKAELARRSGILTPTVIKIVDFLLEKGLVLETGERSMALGQARHAEAEQGRLLRGGRHPGGRVHPGGACEPPSGDRAGQRAPCGHRPFQGTGATA